MNTNQLLNALNSQHTRQNVATPAFTGEYTPFDELLESARAGSSQSTAKVKLAKGVDLKLNEEQLGRIGAAIDLAEANGGGRVMVLIDGRALQVDVATRTVLAEAAPGKTATMPGVDAVVAAPADPAAPQPQTPVNIQNVAATVNNTQIREMLGALGR